MLKFISAIISCGFLVACSSQSEVKNDSPAKLAGLDGNSSIKDAEIQLASARIESSQSPAEIAKIRTYCESELAQMPGVFPEKDIVSVCQEIKHMPGCQSVSGVPIVHFDRVGTDVKGKKVLSMALIHGDEMPSGSVTRAWMARLLNIEPRNSWRVIPVVNPDGFKARTRYNANKVDLNRNFPSHDWDQKALDYWVNKTKSDKRRYPGPRAASEPETQCVIKQIEDFKPDFIISVHTPLGVLDFDGPEVSNPGFNPLPWVGLGNFAGSLGRFMWVDNKVPVLTIELKGNRGIQKLEDFDRLQDVSGTVAMQAARILESENLKDDKKIK